MNFKGTNMKQNDFQFYFGDLKSNYVENYKYMGLMVDHHLIFKLGTSARAESASRALGDIIAKTKQNKKAS